MSREKCSGFGLIRGVLVFAWMLPIILFVGLFCSKRRQKAIGRATAWLIEAVAGRLPWGLWETDAPYGAIPVHTRVIGGVLCRWCGYIEPKGAEMLDLAFPESCE